VSPPDFDNLPRDLVVPMVEALCLSNPMAMPDHART
jgi:hypothetical protein